MVRIRCPPEVVCRASPVPSPSPQPLAACLNGLRTERGRRFAPGAHGRDASHPSALGGVLRGVTRFSELRVPLTDPLRDCGQLVSRQFFGAPYAVTLTGTARICRDPLDA